MKENNMDLDNLTLGQIKQLQALFGEKENSNNIGNRMIGQYCIARGGGSGVHVGLVTAISGKEVLLKNSRRIYYFKHKTRSLCTLTEVAREGIDPEKSKICLEIQSEIYLPEIFELIPVTDVAKSTMDACHAK